MCPISIIQGKKAKSLQPNAQGPLGRWVYKLHWADLGSYRHEWNILTSKHSNREFSGHDEKCTNYAVEF